MNIASPREGSPSTVAAACARRSRRSSTLLYKKPAAKIAAATTRSATELALAETYGTAALAAQPPIEKPYRRRAMHRAAGNPHHQAGQLLIGGRVDADAAHAHRRISGVPGALRQRHQRPERAFDERCHEQAGGRQQIAAAPRI